MFHPFWSNILRRGNLAVLLAVILAFAGCVGYYARKQDFEIRNMWNSVNNFEEHDITFTLLSLTTFRFIHNPKRLCSRRFQNTENRNILSVVHSSRSNFKSREILRKTHGSVLSYNGWNIQVVFTIGIAHEGEEKMIEGLLEREWIKYGDVIMGNFEDQYRNMTYKHLMGYKWVTEFCPEANYYIKSDDDAVVNIFHAIDFLSSSRSKTMYKDFYCRSVAGYPIRELYSKWRVSVAEYPNKKFPLYCGYATYLVGIETVRRILEISTELPFLWIDDVFVSGVLREFVNQKSNISMEAIEIIYTNSQFIFEGGGLKTVESRKGCLGLIVEDRSADVMCSSWNLFKAAHDVSSIYVAHCNLYL